MAIQPLEQIEKEMIQKLEEIEEDESIDLMTDEGREIYAKRMSEIQAGLELMQRVLLKHGLEGGFIEETTRVLEQIEEMEPTQSMSLVPSWFVDTRTGNPAIFVFPTNPSDAMGEPSTEDVYTPNGLWYAKAQVYHVSAILARVFPLPNYKRGEIVPTPVWQVYDCAWVSRLNAQAMHLYRFDEEVPWGLKAPSVPEPPPEPAPEPDKKSKKKGKESPAEEAAKAAVDTGTAAKPKTLGEIMKQKYTPEKYFEDIKVTVDAFKCNEVFFLLQTLQVRYVAVFSQLVRRIYGEQLLREMTIAATLEEYLNMRKGFGESISDSWFSKLSDKVLAILLICVFGLAGLFLFLAFTSGGNGQEGTIAQQIGFAVSMVGYKLGSARARLMKFLGR